MGQVHHDPVEKNVLTARTPQDSGAFNLAAESIPIGLRPPANLWRNVMDVDNPAYDLAKQQERHHYDLGPDP